MTAYLAATPAQSTLPLFLQYRAPCAPRRALCAAWLPRPQAPARSGCQGPPWATCRALLLPPNWPAFPLESLGVAPHLPASVPASRPALLLLPEALAHMLLSVS